MDAVRDPSIPMAGPSSSLDDAAAALVGGRLQQAFANVKAVLAQSPDDPRALGMLGQIAVMMEQPARGLQSLQRAVVLDKRLDHWIWLAVCLAKLDCHDDALRAITAATRTMPATANAHFAIGMVLDAIGRNQEAASAFAGCVALESKRAAAHYRYARSLQAAGQIQPAIEAYADAIRYCGTKPDYHADLSSALSDLGRFEEACSAARTATELDPGCLVGYNNLGHALHSLNRSAEACIAYEKAIAIRETYAKAQFGYAVALLKSGDFALGWRQYEWRWLDCQRPRRDLTVPRWQGEDLAGKTILLHAEQGLGDTLQFVRFAPLAAARGARVVLEVPWPLVRLLRCIDGVDSVIACGEKLPPVDLHCPMASLPLAFNLGIETIPAAPYLRLPPQHDLSRQGPVVGLVWAGDPRPADPRSNLIDRRRSTTLDTFGPLFAIEGVQFVSFQFGPAREEIAAANWPIIDAIDGVTDFADTASRLNGVDLLISVDTSMVHLSGGLGMPVWMLSRFDGCWRWMERRDRSPWYPSMRIFRQTSPGDWSSPIAAVCSALSAWVLDHGASARDADGVYVRFDQKRCAPRGIEKPVPKL